MTTAAQTAGGKTALTARGTGALAGSAAARREREPRWRRRWRRGRQSWARLRQEGEVGRRLLLGAPLVAVGFAVWAFGGVYGWAYGSAYLLVFGALGAWCVQCWRGRMRAVWRPIYWPMLAFGALTLAQCLGASQFPGETLTALLHLSAAGAVFVLVSQLYRRERDPGWIAVCFAVFTAALALLAILQILTASQGIYWKFTYAFASPAGSFVNRNNFAGCMEMLLPIACIEAYWRRHQSWLHFLPWAAMPALGVAAVILAASRGGVVAITMQALAGLGVFWYVNRRPAQTAAQAGTVGWLPLPAALRPQLERRQGRRRSWRKRRASDPGRGEILFASRLGPWFTLGIAVALTTILVAAVGTGRLQSRLENKNPHAPGVEERHQLNLSSWAMFKQHPLMGWGLGTWADAYPAYARFTDTAVFAFAHNDYLQLLMETGVAGALCALVFWLVWGWMFLERIRRWPARGGAPAAAALAVAAALACLGILVHSWVDYNLHIPANLMLFFALAGMV